MTVTPIVMTDTWLEINRGFLNFSTYPKGILTVSKPAGWKRTMKRLGKIRGTIVSSEGPSEWIALAPYQNR